MMEVTVSSGTSLQAFTDDEGQSFLGGLSVAGKTGTLRPDEDEPTASWFIGFAPSRSPRLVVSVLLQNGRVWRRKGNEVARDVFRAYYAARRHPGVAAP
jgi:cell division protein FtsI/penicillin-binding protein 2